MKDKSCVCLFVIFLRLASQFWSYGGGQDKLTAVAMGHIPDFLPHTKETAVYSPDPHPPMGES